MACLVKMEKILSSYREGERHKPMSTEEFLRQHVFKKQSNSFGGTNGIKQERRGICNLEPERMIFTNSAVPQAGPEGANEAVLDYTSDNLPAFEVKLFVTPLGTAFGQMELLRDKNGRIIRRCVSLGGNQTLNEYGYDLSGRLIVVKENGVVTEQYAYGVYGERLHDGCGNQYYYDNQLQLIAIQKHNIAVASFRYNVKGQLTGKISESGITRYGYNQYGILTDVLLTDSRHIHYTIDPVGRRIAKSVNGQVVEKYCWYDMVHLMGICDGNDQNAIHFLYTKDKSDTSEWLPSGIRIGGDIFSLAFDQAGALLAIADSNSNVIQKNTHESFGSEAAIHGQNISLPLSFGGGLLDRDTGLIHFVYRDYDPSTAHFIQPDPLGYNAGDIEIYGWCLDDPVNLIDPLGLKGKRIPGIDLGPVFDNASKFSREFAGATMTWWDLSQHIPESRQLAAEQLAKAIANAQKEENKPPEKNENINSSKNQDGKK